MAKISRPTSPDTLLTSRRSYSIWAATVASLAKTPRNLDRPRKDVSDLDLAAAVIPEMRRELIELWEAFTLNRAEVSRYLMDPKKEALTYLLGFHLANLARTQGMLRRVEHRMGLISWLREQNRPLHIEDLGCGTGALTFATLDLLFREEKKLPCSVELVDKSKAFLDAAAHGLQQLDPAATLVTRQQRLDEYLERERGKADEANENIVWHQLGYVWNEIAHSPKTSQAMLRHLGQGLKQGRRLITLIEPATQDLARAAQQLRDELCAMGYQALYPCPHSANCPMLERARDWCYSEWEWQQPPLMPKIDRILGIDRHRLGASAYVFVSPDIAMALRTLKNTEGPDAVVVGRPLDEKAARGSRKFNYLLCTDEGLIKEPVDAGPERLRGVVWKRMEKPKVTPVTAQKSKAVRKPQKTRK
ncbi:small ribosomal subunit Rsm22 family protein [Oligoflexus tunisiensis]|uniref:small ribosomal subunit Rsm22 family protein n=1 Tax=Oligoflexus tunisiensis TaxID=708132 RepID=UPI00114CBE71|nr:small ribosomal subunit Rsm22 family protein [Oligoflexus tunisiensis]